VPLMVANLLSFVISRRYQPVPIYHALLEQDGVVLPRAPVAGVDVASGERAAEPPTRQHGG